MGKVTVKLLLLPAIISGFGLNFCGCGSATGGIGSTPASTNASQPLSHVVKAIAGGQKIELEVPNLREDGGDDLTIYSYGHVAGARQEQAITVIVKRYYDAARDGESATVCSLTQAKLAESLPEEYRPGAGPAYLSGKTCASVMSKILDYDRTELSGATEVTGVRVKGATAIALLRSTTLPYVYVSLERQRGGWKFTRVLGSKLP